MRTSLFLAAAAALAVACGAQKIAVTPAVLQRSGDNVTVTWSGIPSPTDNDTIAIFSGNGLLLATELAHVDRARSSYRYGTGTEDHRWEVVVLRGDRATGSGSATFWLPNYRRDNYTFGYYSDTKLSHLVATSPPVTFAQGNLEPTQVHIARTTEWNRMRVMWVSGSPGSPPTVRFGKSAGSLTGTATGTSQTYSVNDLCEAPVGGGRMWLEPGWIHDVVVDVSLVGATPGQTVYYTVESDGVAWQSTASFLVPPPSGADPDSAFKFIMYADMGTEKAFCPDCKIYHQVMGFGRGALSMVDRIMATEKIGSSDSPAFITHLGDISYARNTAYKWDVFFHTVQPLAQTVPYHVSIGNHEYDHRAGGEGGRDPSGVTTPGGYRPSWGNQGDDSDGECGVPTARRFHMPDTGNGVFWYSYTSHNLAHVVLSIEHSLETGSQQRAWLERTLAAIDRRSYPWLIVGAHRPMYNSEADMSDYNLGVNLRGVIGDLMYKYNVDLFLAGHYHSYERTCPVYNGTCRGTPSNPGGTVHVTVGTAGIGYDTPKWLEVPWSQVRYSNVFGYSRISVANATSLRWELVDTVNGTLLDDMWLTSAHDFSSWKPRT